ncbi:MAG: M1 family peptidase [Saprospiraceae bacterium]|nr:M1 family peptidase [Saprospiraceae bacterium]MBK8371788.1 M1 family peptidase [Saprospiraceae bacterium]MBK8853359.1 M1 family peptidase [Saprospiraceae bacterium]
MKYLIPLLFILQQFTLFGQTNTDNNPFRQMYDLLPTPNSYRTASGMPGKDYFQQRADYLIHVTLDDNNQILRGKEKVTFYNNSQDALTYIWIQLDQNQMSQQSDSYIIQQHKLENKTSSEKIEKWDNTFDGGYKIEKVFDEKNKNLKYTVNKTMMRIDLPMPLKPGNSFIFQIEYWYNINDRMKLGGRSGFEYFKEDDNYLYTIAQFFPRLCAYNDVEGWQNKQFLGAGEFTLIFGNYEVHITVPEDHLVAATGTLQNIQNVLTQVQQDRFKKAQKSFEQPVIISTMEEAISREKKKSNNQKTWIFKAENVRDFAFASSRKFIWDAMNVQLENGTSMAMSMYPKEGNPLWEKYSTKTVAHTLKVYSKYTIDYPYPVAWSINADRIGMEYPMISFNFGRCEKDGTYSKRTKYGVISVIIHEVGHNFFPMIINSDERQWTWMDEGLTTFVQYLTEQEFERNYPSDRGEAQTIVDYMKGEKNKMSPVMTNSESIHQFGSNAYHKPAVALNILRETVMGRELFDSAFKEYARRWAFKQPYPADFFRTMEDASGVDLDWFWRSWFYTTDHVDISISNVNYKKVLPKDPSLKEIALMQDLEKQPENISKLRNKTAINKTYNERDTTLNDFYTTYDENKSSADQFTAYEKLTSDMTPEEKEVLNNTEHFYEISFERIGGIVMPIVYKKIFEDGTEEIVRIPAEIWKMGDKEVTKVEKSDKKIISFILDPFLETADIDTQNNYFPRVMLPTRFEIYKNKKSERTELNPMQKAKKEEINRP